MLLLDAMDSGWLVPTERRRETPHRYDAGRPLVQPLEAVVWHYTASGSTMGTLTWLCAPASKVSAHFVVGRDGAIWQLAPLTARTWHAGGPWSRLFGRGNTNGRTVGIEVVNWGPLARSGRNRLVNAYDRQVDDVAAAEHGGKLWAVYPEAQIVACEALASALAREVPLLAEPHRHVGHQDVDPSRKTDPGPAWPWARIRAALRPTLEPRGCRVTEER